jgi:hypothetical protein
MGSLPAGQVGRRHVSAKSAAWVAWGAATVIFGCTAATVVLLYLNRVAVGID